MQSTRGKLKIFFGAEAGVGKSFTMLAYGRELKAKGADVVIGLIDTHGRPEMKICLEGLEIMVPKRVADSQELDLDGALIRRPEWILVDDLAHQNPPGCRHVKRWQDVEELLDAGIHVATTLNVQQLESLNEEIGRITGKTVDETVPDIVFDRANEIKLIDLPPDELLGRMKAGKIHLPTLSGTAIRHYYRPGNLAVMRQFAARRTSKWVEASARAYLRETRDAGNPVPLAGDRVLACIGPDCDGERLVFRARRLAAGLHGTWSVLHVQTPRVQHAPEPIRRKILQTLSLAEELGGESFVIAGSNVASDILKFARAHEINTVVFGKTHYRGWLRWFRQSIADSVIAKAQGIHFHFVDGVIRKGLLEDGPAPPPAEKKSRYVSYLIAAGISAMLIAFGLPLRNLVDPFAIVLLLVTGVYFVALKLGRNPSILASVLSALGFAYFYVPPSRSFLLADLEDLIALTAMSTVATVTSRLVEDFRNQAALASSREQHAKALFRLSSELAQTRHEQDTLQVAIRQLHAEFNSAGTILLPDTAGQVVYPVTKPMPESLVGTNLQAAQWAFEQDKTVGHGTDTLRDESASYIPLKASAGAVGILVMKSTEYPLFGTSEQKLFFDSFLQQIALAIERVQAMATANQVSVQVEKELLRNSLLSSISHDLRTPLTGIFGAACVLEEREGSLTPEDRLQLAKVIRMQSQRMSNLTDKILDMVKLSGDVVLSCEWHALEEIIARALKILDFVLKPREVNVRLTGQFTPVYVDATLIQQVLVNLLENACKYSPAGSPIDITVEELTNALAVAVEDRGAGVPADKQQAVFEKFVSIPVADGTTGVGLGLSICKTIIEAHGGTIGFIPRPGGGSIFRFEIPIPRNLPNLNPDSESEPS